MRTRWVICLMLLVASGSANSADMVGQASIVDGDTLEIHGSRIRLWGIDAPESGQLCRGDDSLQYRCGAKAANDLDAFIAGRPVSCLPISLDRYGRTVATCSVGGADLGDWLVRKGLALDWPQYSKRKYESAQGDAEQAGRGDVGRQLCRAVATSSLRPGERKCLQMLGRCQRSSLMIVATVLCNLCSSTEDHAAGGRVRILACSRQLRLWSALRTQVTCQA
jgi:hypothetical protein